MVSVWGIKETMNLLENLIKGIALSPEKNMSSLMHIHASEFTEPLGMRACVHPCAHVSRP